MTSRRSEKINSEWDNPQRVQLVMQEKAAAKLEAILFGR
jgi:hypothetical protein